MFYRNLLLTILLLAGKVGADDEVRAVQEELRRRNIYFGDIDGKRTPELEQATKRYQARKGFSANGSEDRETLRSLGLLPRSANEPPPKELEWPAEPVLKSDAVINVGVEARQIAAETGVAPASFATEKKEPRSTSSRRRSSSRTTPLAPASSGRAAGRGSATDQRLEPAEVRRFVGNYLKAMGRNDVRDELAFYADRVGYYANGEVDRRIIERTLQRYYQRWPSRKYSLGQIIGVAMVPGRGEIVVTFRVNFSLKGNGRSVRGQTDNRFTINAATADPRIVSIEERRVRL